MALAPAAGTARAAGDDDELRRLTARARRSCVAG